MREEFPMKLSSFPFSLVLKYGFVCQPRTVRGHVKHVKVTYVWKQLNKMFSNFVPRHIICSSLSIPSPR